MGQLPDDLDVAAFHAAVDDAFEKQADGLGETRELVIVRGGRLVFERAALGYNTNMRLVSWSMAKSVTQALVGIAAAQGKLVYFMTIDQARFRRPVVPGDQLRVKVTKLQKRLSVWRFTGQATVGSTMAAEAVISAKIMDRAGS